MTQRRSRGEGTIYYSDKSSRWIGQLTLPNGKKKTKHGKTQGDVKKWLLNQRKQLQEGVYVIDDTNTVSIFLNKYIEDIATNTLAPRTVISYKYLITNHINPEIGNIRLSLLRPEHLQTLYTKKLAEGLSRRTVQYIHQFIHTALKVACKWGLVLRNVADLAQAPIAEKKTPVILTVTQVNELLAMVREDRLYALYVCAVSLGIREGELLALNWDDIDFEKKTLKIDKQLQYIPNHGLIIKPPKTKSSFRTLPLPDIAFKALAEHKKYAAGNLIFATGKGTPYYPKNLLRHFHSTLVKMGLPKMAFHNLRHGCASYHLALGTNPKVVQTLLGHATVVISPFRPTPIFCQGFQKKQP